MNKIDDILRQLILGSGGIALQRFPGDNGISRNEAKQALLQAILEAQPQKWKGCKLHDTPSDRCRTSICLTANERNHAVDQYSAAIKELFGGSDGSRR